MIGNLADRAMALSRRERRLLVVMLGVAVPLGVWFGLLHPLQEARHQAQTELVEAQALHQWVKDRATEAQALRAQDTPERVEHWEPIGLSGLEAQLRKAQLWSALAELGSEGEGTIVLRFDDVDFVELADWLSAAHPNWGYRLERFQFEALPEPSRVSARIELQELTKK